MDDKLLDLKARAGTKGITLFFRGDFDFPIIFGCFGPKSGDHQMKLVEGDNWDKVKMRLSDWVDRYPDVAIDEIWVC